MTWVKICGLTRREDVTTAIAAGADAVGFVVAAGSVRRVAVRDVAALATGVPATTVLVTQDESPRSLLEKAARAGVTAVQPHGRHTTAAATAARAAGLEVVFPRHPQEGRAFATVPPDWLVLLDTPHPLLAGGTGRPFDWDLVTGIERDFVIAGGLGPDNVRHAVAVTGAFGVDASSRLEAAPGRKDPDIVRRFVAEAKQP